MASRDFNRMVAIPIGAQVLTPANLEGFAEHARERIAPEDALSVCGALARRLEALRAIEDLREEIAALRLPPLA
jgi:hypothetical protein